MSILGLLGMKNEANVATFRSLKMSRWEAVSAMWTFHGQRVSSAVGFPAGLLLLFDPSGLRLEPIASLSPLALSAVEEIENPCSLTL